MQLWVQPTGARLWRLAYRFDGKQMLLSLGSYPVISLADARQARDEANRLLNGGADPAQERTFHKASSPKDTFRSIANEYVDKLKKEGRADREIDTATILTVLRRAEGSRPI
ncbi:Arm DNA-binding domain-containing protein [Mesorhizobium australafricanum]|uniref:Arm DNA-binding domain-containing protein n=1 Tax=Mesorhizobium australafricanum TaxID=3072311 RepID=A0ABU4X776_9HYPH|nr:Arm DNA-binding domain-containing protein [Mesorhizobium sp. VK3E]MDX8442899.1 Arm DNA-binding domain-containing protein [Mesorhizobium sp. VK3E]